MARKAYQKTALAWALAFAALGAGPHGSQTAPPARADNGTKATPLFDLAAIPGDYSRGDGLGLNVSLKLSEDHRFETRGTGCVGEWYRNAGTWAIQGDVVTLTPETPNPPAPVGGYFALSLRLVPVRWRGKLYLVDQNGTPAFAASARGENLDKFLLGVRHLAKSIAPEVASERDAPVLPERFRDFYAQGPVVAKVSAVNADGTVTLGTGSNGRLRPGLLLTSTTSSSAIDLEVLSTSATTAVARPWYFVPGGTRRPSVGDEFTTGKADRTPMSSGATRYATPEAVPAGT